MLKGLPASSVEIILARDALVSCRLALSFDKCMQQESFFCFMFINLEM